MTFNNDTDDAISFLTAFRPSGPWALVAIGEFGAKKEVRAKTFMSAGNAAAWIKSMNAERWNIYYTVNPTKDIIHRKALKADIACSEWLFVDIDPEGDDIDVAREDILARIYSFELAPTFIVDSGNGFQALYRLRAPIPVDGGGAATKKVEDRGRALELRLAQTIVAILTAFFAFPAR